jgi:hypothetical protein
MAPEDLDTLGFSPDTKVVPAKEGAGGEGASIGFLQMAQHKDANLGGVYDGFNGAARALSYTLRVKPLALGFRLF